MTRERSREPLLVVDDLHVEFRIDDGVVKAVNGLSYTVDKSETVAILGESGSGKSVSAQALMGLVPSPPGFITAGSLRFRGEEILTMTKAEHRAIRGDHISIIFQDALSALNPVFSVGWQISEMFRKHRGASKKEAKVSTIELMNRVRIPDAKERFRSYPHEFSGGMRQRVMIAMALALDPDILIADEPTTALDVTVQAQVMDLLKDLQDEFEMGLVLITHDLGVVAEVADRVVVMYAGRAVEKGSVAELYGNPRHPYTEGLMNSIPRADLHLDRLEPITGSPPDLIRIPAGCAFNPRCPYREDDCSASIPPLRTIDGSDRSTACLHFEKIYQ